MYVIVKRVPTSAAYGLSTTVWRAHMTDKETGHGKVQELYDLQYTMGQHGIRRVR